MEYKLNSNDTIRFVGLALDAALMRQSAIAYNVANSNSLHESSLEVNFEQQWQNNDSSSLNETMSSIAPFYQGQDKPTSIDEQMALSIQNSTHYRALIKGLNQKLSIMKLALQGNNQ